MFYRKSLRNTFVALLTLTASLSQASTVTIPNTFVSNTPAVAAQVNANFSNVKAAVDDNDSNISSNDTDIAALLASVTQLQADLITANNQITMLTSALADTNTVFGDLADDVDDHDARLETLEVNTTTLTTDLTTTNATIATHNTRITTIETNTVLELDGYLMLSTMNGYDTAEFTDINVQINDGSGNTTGVVNGLGNLIIGYNEFDAFSIIFCSEPTYDNQIDCENNSEIWDSNVRRGSHNLIVGYANSYDDYGSVVFGFSNVSNNSYSNVLGGGYNTASGYYSSVSGGASNTASSSYSSVSGGNDNTASGHSASVSGGNSNTASGAKSSVSGGYNNLASGSYSSVTGGENNTASGSYSTVSGGILNNSSGNGATVTGGNANAAGGYASSISGGVLKSIASGTNSDPSAYDWKAGTLFEDL